jgi:hypothetical protein
MNQSTTDKSCSCQQDETSEILSDPNLVREIKLAEKEMKKGKGIPWEKVNKDLRHHTPGV